MTPANQIKAPVPPFTYADAVTKVRIAEDAWNGQNPEKIALAYTEDSHWRNRDLFVNGRPEIIQFLNQKWKNEKNYRLIKELWAYNDNKISVRFAYEWSNADNTWFRAYGNENWQFNANGLMCSRYASINDLAILDSERKFHWAQGRRPDDHPSLRALGL
jgi:nuclear transport factor 2 (NTF2) superfamily protein